MPRQESLGEQPQCPLAETRMSGLGLAFGSSALKVVARGNEFGKSGRESDTDG